MVRRKEVGKEQNGGSGEKAEPESAADSVREKVERSEAQPEREEAEQEGGQIGQRQKDEAAAKPCDEDAQRDDASEESLPAKPFPLVGVGASAGGLDALEKLLSGLTDAPGMSFVIVSHTDPGRTSMLPEILQRATKLPLVTVGEATEVKPNHIYLPPSNKDLILDHDRLTLKEQHRATIPRLPIDTFFKSLATCWREKSACIVLSGTGTDGTHGLRFIKEKGGVVMVQKPESAMYGGMPLSAIATDLADFVLPPEEMITQLLGYFSGETAISGKLEEESEQDFTKSISRIIMALANTLGHDFSMYKKSTLGRRVRRRMSVMRMNDPEQYLSHLYRHRGEMEALFKELLIGVTNFFRDAEAFQFLKEKVLLDLLSRHSPQQPFRVWIPGCSTGEEVYSIVILLMESMAELGLKKELQVFGTDIDINGIEKAREGVYPKNIESDVNPARLARFFEKLDDRFRVLKEVREPVVFAVQNVLRDPPFSRLNLLICRNLLIYLEGKAQKKLLPLFHYSLRSGGALFLGSSESVGEFTDLFSTIHKKFNIYRKRDVSRGLQPIVDFPTGSKSIEAVLDHMHSQKSMPEARDAGVAQAVQQILLEEHSPACIVVNRRGEISYIHGRSGKYLEPATGHATLNVVDMAREGLRFELAAALRKVAESNETIRRENLRVKTNGGYHQGDRT